MNVATQIEELKSRLQSVEAKLEEMEGVAASAGGKLSESYVEHMEELKHQKELIHKHISELELDDAQSWQKSDFGHDLVAVAGKLIDKIDQLLERKVSHSDADRD